MFHRFRAPVIGATLSRFSLKSIICVGLIALSPLSIAQNIASQNSLNLSTAIKRTMAQHPSLKVFKFRQSALNGHQQTQTLKPAYNIALEAENAIGTGNFNVLDKAKFTLSLSSVLEMGNKRDTRLSVIDNRRNMLFAAQEVAALNLLGEVTRRYINVLAAQERLQLANDAAQLTRDTLAEIDKRSRAGVMHGAQVKRAMASVGQATLSVSYERTQLSNAKMALSMLWSETSPSYERVDGDLFAFTADVDFNVLFANIKKNPALLAIITKQRLLESKVRLTQSKSSADITWSVGVSRFQESNDIALSAGVSMALFTAKRNAGAIAAARAALNETTINKQALLLELRGALYQAYSNRQQAIFTVNSLKNSIIPTLTLAFEETRLAYQRGRFSYLDYLSARQELLFSRRALIDAAALAQRDGANIEQLINQPLAVVRHSSLNRSLNRSLNTSLNNSGISQ